MYLAEKQEVQLCNYTSPKKKQCLPSSNILLQLSAVASAVASQLRDSIVYSCVCCCYDLCNYVHFDSDNCGLLSIDIHLNNGGRRFLVINI